MAGGINILIAFVLLHNNYWYHDYGVYHRSRRLVALSIDGEEATDIQFVTTEPQHAERTNGTLYDLQGRRVSQPSKGLYISNGHKYIIK